MEKANERGRQGGASLASWSSWSLAGLSLALCGVGLVFYPLVQPVEPPSARGTGGYSAGVSA